MPKIRDVKRLKIVEQIIVVLLLAVIVPTVVSAIIVNKHKLTGKENELAKEYLRRISETGKDFLTLDELD